MAFEMKVVEIDPDAVTTAAGRPPKYLAAIAFLKRNQGKVCAVVEYPAVRANAASSLARSWNKRFACDGYSFMCRATDDSLDKVFIFGVYDPQVVKQAK